MQRVVLALIVVLLLGPSLFGFEPPPLARSDAQRILESMEWTEVTIIAIRQGVDDKGAVAPIFATVVGLGKCRGQHRPILQTLHFDRDLDWYALELGEKSAHIWNKDGYRAIRPWTTW